MITGIPQSPRKKGDIGSALALIVLVSLVARFVFGASAVLEEAAKPTPQVELTRALGHGGVETLSLKCVPAHATGFLDFCQLSRRRNGIAVASLGIEPDLARQVVGAFLSAAEVKTGIVESIPGAKLGWIVTLGTRKSEGKSTPSDPAETALLQALFTMEAALQTELYR